MAQSLIPHWSAGVAALVHRFTLGQAHLVPPDDLLNPPGLGLARGQVAIQIGCSAGRPPVTQLVPGQDFCLSPLLGFVAGIDQVRLAGGLASQGPPFGQAGEVVGVDSGAGLDLSMGTSRSSWSRRTSISLPALSRQK